MSKKGQPQIRKELSKTLCALMGWGKEEWFNIYTVPLSREKLILLINKLKEK